MVIRLNTWRLNVSSLNVSVDLLSDVVAPDGGWIERHVEGVVQAPQGFEGEGFPVRRAFAGVRPEILDPFIHMDQMGWVDYAPYEPRGTDWHPHRGFETVTYMMEGEFLHQDTQGGGGTLKAGDTQWMTAGAGILHIETPPEHLVISGGAFHGIQLWVNLPRKDKFLPPAYQHLAGEKVTVMSPSDGASIVRLIAGELAGQKGPGSTRTPITLTHVTVAAGELLSLPWDPTFNALGYVLNGVGRVSSKEVSVATGQLVIFGEGNEVRLRGGDVTPLDILLLGGEPIGGPVAKWGPFVMNTRAELEQALSDYRSGKLGVIPEDAIQPYRGRRY